MDEKKLSRRSFFRGAIAGAAVVAGVIPIKVAYAQKADKKSMQYQDTPKDGQQCDACVYFQAPNKCGIVEGDISPKGWCVAYNKKK
jgi:spermidine/putrescine-binding protein